MRSEAEAEFGGFLPLSLGARLAYLPCALGNIAFALLPLYVLAAGPGATSWRDRLLRLTIGEFFAAWLAFSSLWLVWLVAAPRWLPAAATRAGLWLGACVLLLWIVTVGIASYAA